MCKILEDMRDEAMQIGIEKGIEKGIEQGATENLVANVQALMASVGWSAQQALDTLRVPKSEQARYLAML